MKQFDKVLMTKVQLALLLLEWGEPPSDDRKPIEHVDEFLATQSWDERLEGLFIPSEPPDDGLFEAECPQCKTTTVHEHVDGEQCRVCQLSRIIDDE